MPGTAEWSTIELYPHPMSLSRILVSLADPEDISFSTTVMFTLQQGAVNFLLIPQCPQLPTPISNVYSFNKYLLNSWKVLQWILEVQGCIKINTALTFKVFSLWRVT